MSFKEFLYIRRSHGATLPAIKTNRSAGYDLYSCDSGEIAPRSHDLVKTGISMKIPDGYCGQIWSRSGLSVKYGIETGAGIIDSDYSGEIGVVLHNYSDKIFKYEKGMRVAQILIVPIITPGIIETDYLQKHFEKDNNRGAGGFGSTGDF